MTRRVPAAFVAVAVASFRATAALAAAPAPPPACAAATATFANTTPVAVTDNVAVTSTITVSGVGSYLFDLDLTTNLRHTFAADLDVTLTSPAGTVVTITTDNGGQDDDVFNGRLFDDDASPSAQVPYAANVFIVTDHLYTNKVATPPLVVEEALAAFLGEDPNGVWTLTVFDDRTGDTGSLDGWRLDVTTLPAAPATATASVGNATVTPLADAAVTTSTITVSGLGTYLLDVNVLTAIRHTFSADIDMTLMSPAGTIVTLTTDNGGANDDVFDGTLWDDDADPGNVVPYTGNPSIASDHAYTNGVAATPLVPEEALGAFIGEDPNGVWTLTISDDAAADTGTLDAWTLDLTTAVCPRRVIRVL